MLILQKNVENIVNLFDENVEYYETPTEQINTIKEINNKGFMLAETLIVSLFVMSTFSMLYVNILPLIAEYEKYKDYNTVEATYKAHWARKLVLDGISQNAFTNASNYGYFDITDCLSYSQNNVSGWCYSYKEINDITKIYLVPYNLEKFKNHVKSNSSYTREFKDYISYLPTYSKNTTKVNDGNYFHVIIEFNKGDKHNYGIMEVHRK